MTRKDYELLAKAFKQGTHLAIQARGDDHRIMHVIEIMVGCVADELIKDNPRFDIDKFLSAAGQ